MQDMHLSDRSVQGYEIDDTVKKASVSVVLGHCYIYRGGYML